MRKFKFWGISKLSAAVAAFVGLGAITGANAAGNLHDAYDEHFWLQISALNSVEAYQAYLYLNPEGLYAEQARQMLVDSATASLGEDFRQHTFNLYNSLKEVNDVVFPQFAISNIVDVNYAG